MRRVLAFAIPYRRALAGFVLLLSIDAAIGAAIPWLYRDIIDDGIVGGNEPLVIGLALTVAGLAVASAVAALAQRWLSAQIGESLVCDLRTALFDHVQRLPVASFSRTQTGARIQRLNGDVLGAQQAFTSTCRP